MLILVQIDLSSADLASFDRYKKAVLALLAGHGASLIARVRATDGRSETHLLQFPDAAALDAFKADPARTALQGLWTACGASSTVTEVVRVA